MCNYFYKIGCKIPISLNTDIDIGKVQARFAIETTVTENPRIDLSLIKKTSCSSMFRGQIDPNKARTMWVKIKLATCPHVQDVTQSNPDFGVDCVDFRMI